MHYVVDHIAKYSQHHKSENDENEFLIEMKESLHKKIIGDGEREVQRFHSTILMVEIATVYILLCSRDKHLQV